MLCQLVKKAHEEISVLLFCSIVTLFKLFCVSCFLFPFTLKNLHHFVWIGDPQQSASASSKGGKSAEIEVYY
ncbi:hypothetical protein K1719_026516 [Acacia pycnantha]|nr:hypothetical protein K1719_026516 [Acacia pycnantha]